MMLKNAEQIIETIEGSKLLVKSLESHHITYAKLQAEQAQ